MHFIHTTQTLRLLLICGLAIALLPSNGLRAAGQIGNGTPGSCTEAVLRSAIASGGSISFNCGAGMATITLTSTLAVSENATIDGGGPNQGGRVTLSGGGQTTIMSIEPGVTLTLSNLTIRDGRDVSPDPMNQFGGVGVGSGATLAVNNSRFLNNDGVPGGTERGGGAISTAPDSTVIVRDSEFSGNHGVNGGAINMLLSSLTVENSTFTNNDSLVAAYNIPDYVTGYGGAIYVDGASPHGGTGGELIVRNSSFINNKARDQGGAILSFVYNGDSTTIEGSTFTGNRAGSAQQVGIGGALRHGNGPLTIRDSTFADNTVYGDGGAIWAGATTPGIFSNLTITNNRAEAAPNHRSFGGAFYITEGTYSITNSTIAGNFADQSGGAIIGGSSPIALNNTIIVNNTTAIDSGYARQCAASFSGGNNLQWPPFDLDFSGCGDGTIVGNPLLAVLGPNGGGSATMATLPPVRIPTSAVRIGWEPVILARSNMAVHHHQPHSLQHHHSTRSIMAVARCSRLPGAAAAGRHTTSLRLHRSLRHLPQHAWSAHPVPHWPMHSTKVAIAYGCEPVIAPGAVAIVTCKISASPVRQRMCTCH